MQQWALLLEKLKYGSYLVAELHGNSSFGLPSKCFWSLINIGLEHKQTNREEDHTKREYSGEERERKGK